MSNYSKLFLISYISLMSSSLALGGNEPSKKSATAEVSADKKKSLEIEPSHNIQVQTSTASPELKKFFKTLSKLRTFKAKFIEEKHMKLLSKPLVSKGIMAFRAPDELIRKIEGPRSTKVMITPKSLITIAGEQVDRIDLTSHPEVLGLVGSVLQILQGNLSSVSQSYLLELSKNANDRWDLVLVPRSERLSALVKRIIFSGKGTSISKIIVDEATGDRSVTRLSDVDIDQPFSFREEEALFGR